MVHDSHGSIELSSISQARDINSRGIFIISAPQKFKVMVFHTLKSAFREGCFCPKKLTFLKSIFKEHVR